MSPRIAVFVATSGHSGVDRAMQHLIPTIARRGYPIDLLHVKKHGPNLDPTTLPANARVVERQGLYGPLVPVDDHETLARALQDTLDAPLARQFVQQAALPYEIERATSAYLTALGLDPKAAEAPLST